MSNFTLYKNSTVTLVCVPPDQPVLFSVDTAAELTGVHPEMLQYYCRTNLIEIQRGEEGTEIFLDQNALREIRQIEHYRRHLGVGRRALPLIRQLQRESERQHIDIPFLRCENGYM